jgi:hypothetical protein
MKGTQIAVEPVIDLLGRGYTTEDVHACLAYPAEVLQQSEKVYALPR